MKSLKHISTLVLLLLAVFTVKGQEFELRFVQTSCSTFRVDARCTNASYVPTTSTSFDAFDFGVISPYAFALSLDTNSFLQQSFTQSSNGTVNSYNYLFFSLSNSFTVSSGNEWTLNTWKSIVSFTMTSGSTILQAGSDALTNFTYGAYIATSGNNGYSSLNETDIANTVNQLGKTWTGATDGDWTIGTNWCPSAAPNNTENLIIDSTANHPLLQNTFTSGYITLASGAVLNLDDNSLTIGGELSGPGFIGGSASSSLTFSGTGSAVDQFRMDTSNRGTSNVLLNLTLNRSTQVELVEDTLLINGILTLTQGDLVSNDKVILNATGKSTYGQVAPGGTGTVDGSLIIEKQITSYVAGWRQIALPLSGNVTALSGPAVLTSAHTTAAERNVYWYDASGSPTPTGWTEATDTDNDSKAYMLYCDTASTVLDTDSIWSFIGDYSPGTKNYSASYVSSGTADQDGWNLIPNPYPSNIDVSALLASSSFSGITYKALHVWDMDAEQYRGITASGVTLINYNANDTALTDVTDIGPFQAFWVKVDNQGTFSLTDNIRTTAMGGVRNFFKKDYDLLRLNITDANQNSDQSVVYFADGATYGLDNLLDAFKRNSLNDQMPSLSSKTDKDELLSINALVEGEYEYHLPLNFESKVEGSMTFDIDRDAFDASWKVYIEDKLTGKLHEFSSGAYTFTRSSSDKSDRFILHISRYALAVEDVVNAAANEIQLNSSNGDLQIVSTELLDGSAAHIELFDVTGKLISDHNIQLNGGIQLINNSVNSEGLYYVRITGVNFTKSATVFLKP